jgi:uncharacterized membrane protein YqiK
MKTPNQTKSSEVIELPSKVFNANWRDDIPEELTDEENEMAFEVYSDEKNYQSPEEVTAKAERRIRIMNAKRGKKIGSLLSAA